MMDRTLDEAIEQFKYDAECNRADLDLSFAEDNDKVAERLEELKQYRAIGTPEKCREAVEKQKAKKPHKNYEKFSGVWCSCGSYLGVDKPNYCSDCGQKLDWSDEE